MRRFSGATLSLLVLLGACTTSGGGSAPELRSEDKKERPPRPPQRAVARKVTSNLTPKQVRPCLYDDRVDMGALAGQYYGPIDLVAGEVELARDLDFTLPDDIQMLEKDAFFQEFESGRKPLTRKQVVINRWIESNLGYRTFSTRKARPDKEPEVAGFYRSRGEKVVVRQKGELDAEYIVLAHELAHAATDQRFGLGERSRSVVIDDEELAYAALVEGDATLTEFRIGSRWGARKAVTKLMEDVITAKSRFKEDRADDIPYASIDRSVFPYRWGVTFACRVFDKKGWGGVNRAYVRPPRSTAEVMFPERFFQGEKPRTPKKLGSPPERWKVFAKSSIGAAHLKALFEAPADRESRALSNPLGRAAAWDGGSLTLWARNTKSAESILGMSFVERKNHSGVLCSSLIKWYEHTYSEGDPDVLADNAVAYEDSLRSAVIDCRGNGVQVVIAPEPHLARAVLDL